MGFRRVDGGRWGLGEGELELQQELHPQRDATDLGLPRSEAGNTKDASALASAHILAHLFNSSIARGHGLS